MRSSVADIDTAKHIEASVIDEDTQSNSTCDSAVLISQGRELSTPFSQVTDAGIGARIGAEFEQHLALASTRRQGVENSWSKQHLNNRLVEAVNKAPLALLTIGFDGHVLAANNSCSRILGIPATLLADTVFFNFLCKDSAVLLRNDLRRSSEGLLSSSHELTLNISHPLTDKRTMQVLIANTDITQNGQLEFVLVLLDTSRQQQIESQLRSAKDYLERLATHDALTGLPNRIHFTEALRTAMFNARKAKRQLALLYFDIDGFKGVNDQYGHHVGDALLREIANRLRVRTREVGRLARLGGDEFTLIMEHRGCYESLLAAADKVRIAISEPITIPSAPILQVSASIGIATYPKFAKTPRQLIQYADNAMYQAKGLGGDCVVKFSSLHQEKLKRTAALENDFRHSIQRSDFVLYFQPIVNCCNGQLDTLEVLVRWNHPEYGMILPDEFIPMAERSGLINELGSWIVESTCRVSQRLQKSGSTVRFAINLSPVQLNKKDLAQDILSCLKKYDLQPQLFDLEITESCIMSDIDCALTQVTELSEHGFSLAVDDFGTGHSSLARLTGLPVSKIKLDRLFISRLAADDTSRVIVKGIINIAHELGISVVAEGVEDHFQTEILCSYGCGYVQGFGILRPCPEEDLAVMLQNGLTTPGINQEATFEEYA